jgi:hypothetical protein
VSTSAILSFRFRILLSHNSGKAPQFLIGDPKRDLFEMDRPRALGLPSTAPSHPVTARSIMLTLRFTDGPSRRHRAHGIPS